MTTKIRNLPLVAVAALVLTVSACGGGGPATDGDDMMPGDGDGMTPGDGDGMMPGDGDGMVTEYGHGLEASPLSSPTASSATDSLENLDAAETAFAPVTAPVKITSDDMGQAGVVLLEDDEEA